MHRLRGWADLPDGLLDSIIARLGLASFPDIVSFAATCRSWRASVSTLLPLLPPLLLQPDVPLCSPCRPPIISNNVVPTRPCHVINIANQVSYQCCRIPLFCPLGEDNALPSPRQRFYFNGASFGHLIFSSKKSCIIVDVFKGVSVSAPQLPVFKGIKLCYAVLTAPLASPNSHLIVDTGSRNLFWRVGSQSWVGRQSWVGHSSDDGTIKQIVVFKGRVFGMDSDRGLFRVHLKPQIRIQELPVLASSRISKWRFSNAWLVVCGDMLLLVALRGRLVVTGETFKVFCLDLSTEPASWLEMEKVENWAIFISTDMRSQTLSCMNPETWGGRSNCIYCYNHESKNWIALEVGKPLQGDGSRFNPNVFIFTGRDSRLQPMWIFPSMFSLCRS